MKVVGVDVDLGVPAPVITSVSSQDLSQDRLGKFAGKVLNEAYSEDMMSGDHEGRLNTCLGLLDGC